MGLKVSELRAYAQTSQPAPKQDSGIVSALVVFLSVFGSGAYAYSAGWLEGILPSKPAQQAAAPATVPPPKPAAASTVRPAATAPPPAPTPVPAPLTAVQPGGLTVSQAGNAAKVILKIKLNDEAMEEFGLMIFDMMGADKGRRKPAAPDDIFAYCKEQAERVTTAYHLLPETEKELFVFHMMSESVSCVVKRPQNLLCQPKFHAKLKRQIKAYAMVRTEFVDMAESEAEKVATRRVLERPAHRQIESGLRTLANQGVIAIGDFGWRAPQVLRDAIGDIKNVKPACQTAP